MTLLSESERKLKEIMKYKPKSNSDEIIKKNVEIIVAQ